MGRYLIRRLLAAIPVMVMVATAVFLLLFLTPGDPAAVILGPNATPDQAQALVERAHEVCPYSNATRGNVEVKLGVI